MHLTKFLHKPIADGAHWLATAARLLSMPRCAACDDRLAREALFCEPCATTVQRSEPCPTPSFAEYGGAIASALWRLKYRDRPDLARGMGQQLGGLLRSANVAGSVDLVVPVPLHHSRLVERGYNQAALLAREVADCLDSAVACRALGRVRNTRPQAELSAAERHHNVSGAFRAGKAVRGQHVLLIDDVRTTGATLDACRRALAEVGAASVTAATVAHAPRP